jgi:hypothetical protein
MVSSVSWVETSSDDWVLPQDGQKRESGGTCLPHELQRDIRENASSEECLAEVYANASKMETIWSVVINSSSIPPRCDLLESKTWRSTFARSLRNKELAVNYL